MIGCGIIKKTKKIYVPGDDLGLVSQIPMATSTRLVGITEAQLTNEWRG
jgi:hypothetical protein